MNKLWLLFTIIACFACEPGKRKPSTVSPDARGKSKKMEKAVAHRGSGQMEYLPDSVRLIRHSLNDTLFIDFNGDRVVDKAFLKTAGAIRNLFIRDGASQMEIKVGSDSSFKDIGDDFGWTEFWGWTRDSSTYEVLVIDGEIAGGRVVKLLNTSIVLRAEEDGGGMVSFKNGSYIWIHQAD